MRAYRLHLGKEALLYRASRDALRAEPSSGVRRPCPVQRLG